MNQERNFERFKRELLNGFGTMGSSSSSTSSSRSGSTSSSRSGSTSSSRSSLTSSQDQAQVPMHRYHITKHAYDVPLKKATSKELREAAKFVHANSKSKFATKYLGLTLAEINGRDVFSVLKLWRDAMPYQGSKQVQVGLSNSNTVNSKFHLIRSLDQDFARFLSFHVLNAQLIRTWLIPNFTNSKPFTYNLIRTSCNSKV